VPIGVPGQLFVNVGGGEVPTGERVRLLESGTFESAGRLDGRIPMNGVLVDPGEIARVLETHPAVREAWVVAFEDLTGERRLVAFCVPKPGTSWTETELRTHVRGALGEGRLPRLFVELDVLPRDVTGAVNEERLASPYAGSSAGDYVAPRTDAERYMAEAWQEALGVGRIGVYDNFFDLGGHSLLCFRVIARIEREKGVRLSPRLFLLNTLEQVARQVASAPAPSATAASMADARPGERAAESPRHPETAPPRGTGIRDWLSRIVRK
jgi:hypothetical protein